MGEKLVIKEGLGSSNHRQTFPNHLNCKSRLRAVTNADVKIKEALAIGTPKIKWAVTIPRVPGFQSKLSHVLNNKQDYTLWIETLSDLGRVDAGLTLLIIYSKNPCNTSTDTYLSTSARRTPNNTSYSLMLHVAAKPGVSITSRPKSLQYPTLSHHLKKKKNASETTWTHLRRPWQLTSMITEALLVLWNLMSNPLVALIRLQLPKRPTFRYLIFWRAMICSPAKSSSLATSTNLFFCHLTARA
ncbi:hypothetical protein VP01_707g3 [Puccinia sorghi]|uniref:Uncharacterized protein n=1 Tax=Puccinia sorghi TaxID=27349 RepID=A0A0L6UDM9_9BASI|nr:hypothetical protein VP01_707g3 [Puccinia sorghi]